MISVEVTGLKHLRKQIQRESRAAVEANVMILNEISEETIERAIKGFKQSPATGATYLRYDPYRVHTASAPTGNAYPRIDQGSLMRSLTYTPATRSQLRSTVGSPLPYALDLEYGTDKMMERPWLHRSYRSAVRTVAARMREIYRSVR